MGRVGKNRSTRLSVLFATFPIIVFIIFGVLVKIDPNFIEGYLSRAGVVADAARTIGSEGVPAIIVNIAMATFCVFIVMFFHNTYCRFDEVRGKYLTCFKSRHFSLGIAEKLKQVLSNPTEQEISNLLAQESRKPQKSTDPHCYLEVYALPGDQPYGFGYLEGTAILTVPYEEEKKGTKNIRKQWQIFSYMHPKEKIDAAIKALEIDN